MPGTAHNIADKQGGLFVSRFLHSLDPKKRLTIPAQWRELIGEPQQIYVIPSMGKEACLNLYPAREMLPRLERFRNISITDQKARSAARLLASSSELLAWDTQGRVRIRDELLARARLSDQVLMSTGFDHFELWNPAEYERWQQDVGDLQDAMQYLNL